MKNFKKKLLGKVVLSTVMASCLSFAGGAFAEETAPDFTTTLSSDLSQSGAYIDAGMYNDESKSFIFDKNKTTISVENTRFAPGPWAGQYLSAAVHATTGQKLEIDLQGNAMEINGTATGTSTGITAVGKDGIVEIHNAGPMEINAVGTGQTAALFVNGGGQLFIHNGGEDQESKVLTLTANSSVAGSGAVIKSMNGAAGRSWIKVDGLVDVHGDVANGKGAGEGLSAVASTIEVGGGKIIMTTDGSDPNLNFGGNTPVAIRAYGEFVTQNYGIVNVNVEKEADTADAKAIGAGNNTTQIVGNFSTVGGMGTKGTINVGLNTKDSYWYGNYAFGSGFGVTPGDYGCLNLFMGNGAKWQGWTKYGTNLKMDSFAQWVGYNQGNKNLVMEMKNGATWRHTSNETEAVVNSHVQSLDADKAIIVNGYRDSGDITIENFKGNALVLFGVRGESGVATVALDENTDNVQPSKYDLVGGNVIINNAEEGINVSAAVDGNALNSNDKEVINKTLNDLANKIVVNDKEADVNGTVAITEGLITSGATANLVKGEDGAISVDTSSVKTSGEATLVSSTKAAMTSTAMVWRAEANDIMKRMGDLRLSGGETGEWVKYYGGKYETDKNGSYSSTKYSAVQVGYDKKHGDWTVGTAFTLNNSDSTFERGGNGDGRVAGLAIYGSKVNKNGSYLDLIMKASHIDNEFTTYSAAGNKMEGDFDTWGLSFSAEVGKQFDMGKGFYFDPTAELTYGIVNGADYTAMVDGTTAVGIEEDNFDSLVGRAGFRIGQKLDKASYYAKFAVAHEFCGDYSSAMTLAGTTTNTSVDFGDTWYEVQLGGTAKVSDNTNLYASVQKGFGGDTEEKWRVDAGLRVSF